MSNVVLDASAVLALLFEEPGAEKVMALVEGGGSRPLISSVNLGEVYARLLRDGLDETKAMYWLKAMKLSVVAFEEADAYRTGPLIQQFRAFGLSFGDCVCLALAMERDVPAWTGDRAWMRVDSPVTIELIRP